jgi:hypothetical protein
VDILNQSFWQSPEWLTQNRSSQILRAHDSTQSGRFERERDALKLEVRKTVTGYSEGPNAAIASETLPAIGQFFDDKIKTEFAAATGSIQAAYEKLLTPECPETPREQTINEAWALYQPAAQRLRDLPGVLGADLRTNFVRGSDSKAADDAVKTITASAEKSVRGLIGDKDIFNDPFASAVVNAPDAYWKGEFNKTYGDGTLGNVDIAIKMEDVANFTIKGVRNDAAAITRATFAVGQQAVQTVAALYGIPLPKKGQAQPAADPKAAPTINPPELDSPRVRAALASARENDIRRARAALFEAMISQRDRLADNTKRDQAVTALKEAVANFDGAIKDDSK